MGTGRHFVLRGALVAAALLALVAHPAHADEPVNTRIRSLVVYESQELGDRQCARGEFEATGVLTDRGPTRLCDRQNLKGRTIVGTQVLDGSTGRYVIHYKVRCNEDFIVCDGNWTINRGPLTGGGTTHQVLSFRPDGTAQLQADYAGHLE